MSASIGEDALALMREIFPYPRSLTGSGVTATFDAIERHIPLARTRIPTGTQIFDWQVPNEWNIRDAYVATPDGTRVIDFRRHSLHVVGYSEPVNTTMSLEELKQRLFTLPEQPDLIPYRTSYYTPTWGFCLAHNQLLALEDTTYRVVIDADLGPGHLTFAECEIAGRSNDEVLFSTYVCHPSLANDNLSGIAVATMLAKALAERDDLRFTYRFLFSPGTIGPLSWLHCNQDRLDRIAHGLALSCIGDSGDHTYKRSRRGEAEIDRAVTTVLRDRGKPHTVLEWDPWGGDERQFCSPGFNLPVGCLMRTPHGGFDGYHTSADSLDRISPQALEESVQTCLDVIHVLETNRTPINLSPYGEPQLGRRGLFRTAGGAVASPDDEKALLWVLNLADGEHSLLDIAVRSGLSYSAIERNAKRLEQVGLLGPPMTVD